MAVDFVCNHCGRLTHSPQTSGKTRCMSCGRKVTIPPAVASLPHPVLPHGPPEPLRPPDDPPADPEFRQAEEALARAVPWAISLCLHAGLALVMVLVAMVMVIRPVVGHPAAGAPPVGNGGACVMVSGLAEDTTPIEQDFKRTHESYVSRHEGAVSADTGRTSDRIELIGLGAGGNPAGGLPPFGSSTGRGTVGLWTRDPPGRPVHHVVYLIDKSGSMAVEGMFDNVRQEMLRSIGRLNETQTFHIVLFADGLPDEYGPRRLVPAGEMYKAGAARYLAGIRPGSILGSTDPVPSLRRAFEVIRQADKHRPGRLILFLTDGVFRDNRQVLQVIRRLNTDKEIRINTYLYGFRPPEAVELMKTIALENRGVYNYVSRDK